MEQAPSQRTVRATQAADSFPWAFEFDVSLFRASGVLSLPCAGSWTASRSFAQLVSASTEGYVAGAAANGGHGKTETSLRATESATAPSAARGDWRPGPKLGRLEKPCSFILILPQMLETLQTP